MISFLGEVTLENLRSLKDFFLLVQKSFLKLFQQCILFRFRAKDTLDQLYAIGVESLPVILFSITFLSFMLITEFSFHMKMVLRQDSLVPAFSTLLMVREIGPVFACLLLTSRIGASIAAEIGVMRVTEQLDALRLLGLDPIDYLTVPRLVACVLACMSVSVISVSFALLASAFLASRNIGHEPGQFVNSMFVFTRFGDLPSCLVKSAVFGCLIPLVASHHGFRCRGGAEGVGTAATSAVVHTSMLIIVSDFVLTFFMFG